MLKTRTFWFHVTASIFAQDIKASAETTPQISGPASLLRDGYRWKVSWWQANGPDVKTAAGGQGGPAGRIGRSATDATPADPQASPASPAHE